MNYLHNNREGDFSGSLESGLEEAKAFSKELAGVILTDILAFISFHTHGVALLCPYMSF